MGSKNSASGGLCGGGLGLPETSESGSVNIKVNKSRVFGLKTGFLLISVSGKI